MSNCYCHPGRAGGTPVWYRRAVTLYSIGGALMAWDLGMQVREARAQRYRYAPYFFEDEGGTFFLQQKRGLIGTTFYKTYVLEQGGVLRSEIDEAEADDLRSVGRALWGYVDWTDQFVPGLFRRELPPTERIEYPECYERYGVDGPST
jgi:hypothetical protein